MASILDKYNEHLFLEHNSNKSNSFIANVNRLVQNYDNLVNIDNKFSVEDVQLLSQLAANSLDIDIKHLANDLRKGTFNGYRKLDIDLLLNYKGYNINSSIEEKENLLNSISPIGYNKIEIYFNSGYSIIGEPEQIIYDIDNLEEYLLNWEDLQQRDSVQDDIAHNMWQSVETPISGHKFIRITDNFVADIRSDIRKIVLFVEPNSLENAKQATMEFTWLSSTSALMTLAYKADDVLDAAEFVEQINVDIDDVYRQTVDAADRAQNSADNAADALNNILDLKVTSTTLPVTSKPEAMYIPSLHTISFGLPRSEIAVVGLSNFAIDTANGHLTMDPISNEDVSRVYINDEGNVIIELKK